MLYRHRWLWICYWKWWHGVSCPRTKNFLELARITEALLAAMNDFTASQAVDNMAGNFSYWKWFEFLIWYWILSARVQCSICGRRAKAPPSPQQFGKASIIKAPLNQVACPNTSSCHYTSFMTTLLKDIHSLDLYIFRKFSFNFP